MAQLTWDNYRDLRIELYRIGCGKEEMKTMPNLPSKAQLKAVFQAIEDRFENDIAGYKSDVDTAYGQTTTNALFKKIMKVFFGWKVRQ